MASSPSAHFRIGNLVTYVSIAAATSAAVATTDATSQAFAGLLLAVAALADVFDGRFARLFPRTEEQKQFGVQVDSLSDVLAFGLAPVVVLARVVAPSAVLGQRVLLACGFVYVLCAVTRLAYYNVTESQNAGFVGVPSTMLGVFWSGWLLRPAELWPTCAALVLGGAAMVSAIRIPRPGAKTFVALVLVCVALAAVHAVRMLG